MKTPPFRCLALFALAAVAPGPAAHALELPEELFEGRGASALLEKMPAESAEPDQVFARATVEFLAAVETLGRDFYALGLKLEMDDLPVPFLRLPIPENPEPKLARAADVRRALDGFHGRLAAIDARLAGIEGREFTAIIPLGAASFDFGGDKGRMEFRPFFAAISGGRSGVGGAFESVGSAPPFVVAFDQTDALWLRAYTQLLRGLADVLLAHDGGELFEATGHAYFAKADTALARALAERVGGDGKKVPVDYEEIADVIATLHGIDLVVSEPERLARARVEFLAMIRLSRATLASAAAERDDDREWLPGPAQSSAFGLRLSAEQTTAWAGVLTELEALLQGEKLLPHWRFPAEKRGVNLRRIFEESRRTDLIGYLQGVSAAPYLETGETTSMRAWRELIRVFGGQFLGYALWIN